MVHTTWVLSRLKSYSVCGGEGRGEARRQGGVMGGEGDVPHPT